MASKTLFSARGPLLAVAIGVAVIAASVYMVLQTMPPRTIAMATGAEGGAYFEFGKRCRELLAREGIELRLVSTGGALENLSLLGDPRSGVSVGLIQGGVTNEGAAPELESL